MQLTLSPDDLAPVITRIVTELQKRFGTADRLCYPEAEAAELLGVKQHVLRDARLRGEISGSKLGRGYSYTRAALLEFIERRRDQA